MNDKLPPKERQRILSAIIQEIMSGAYDSSQVPLDKLMQMHTNVRQEYQAPFERDTRNYGYTDIGQMNSNEKPF